MRRKRKQQKWLLEERLRDLQRLEALEAAAQAEGEGLEGLEGLEGPEGPRGCQAWPPGHQLTHHHFCPSPQTLAQD